MICLLETYLNHDTLPDDGNLWIPGNKLVRLDYPSDQQGGSICIYHMSVMFEGMYKFQSECKWETG